jgi:septal ring factor EnvC (AmiA/AmiB activator)
MPAPTLYNEKIQPSWRTGGNVVTALAVVTALVMAAFFFWPDSTSTSTTGDQEVLKALQFIGASQPRTLSGIKSINDSIAAEHARLSMLSDQMAVLVEHLKVVESTSPQILRDNATLAEQLKATQAQLAQDNASVAQQLKDLTKLALSNSTAALQTRESQEQLAGALAKVSEETARPTPFPVRQRPAAAQKRKPQANATNASTAR